MKTLRSVALLLFMFFFSTMPSNAQFWKKLKERAGEAPKETVLQKAEEKTAEKTGQAMDSIFEAPNKIGQRKNTPPSENGEVEEEEEEMGPTIDSNFDFEPGSSIIFFDDFSRDRTGDFPAKWDTNGSGEIVTANGEKWFRLANKSMYFPLIDQDLPENFTLEFDLLTTGLDRRTNSQAFLVILLAENQGFDRALTWNMVEISPCQFIASPGAVEKVENGKRIFRNNIGKDYREAIDGRSRISIAVNNTRMRVWINENKIVDVPRLVPETANTFKLYTRGLRDAREVDELYIKDFRIAETGQDLRGQLLNEGSFTTNDIQFDSGSAKLRPSSKTILDQIGDILSSEKSINIKIIGHTDSDGDEATNLTLSEKRAMAVNAYLQEAFGIDDARMQTEGQGASSPVVPNDSKENKAKNRRVEFIKL